MANNSNSVRYIGVDAAGVPRVWGEGPQADVAFTRCAEEVCAYVARRPDTGPASAWLIEQEAAS